MQIPIVSGIYTDGAGDFRVAYPVNMVPLPSPTGISAGYLRPGDGLISKGVAGVDRGGINYRGEHIRVMGTKLVSISAAGVATVLGDVGYGSRCSFAYSFERLAISSGGRLYYWDGSSIVQVTDPDLIISLYITWVDGYFVSIDGEFLIVTDLNDPLSVNILKYGSAEVDPDPVKAVLVNRNELHAVGRYTMEVYTNTGGTNFPFTRINGAHFQKGAIGTHAVCLFADAIAFLGSGRNEAPAIYLAENAQTAKISTREIDQILATYTESDLANTLVEARTHGGLRQLYVHLPDRTFVYDLEATKILENPVWFVLTTAREGFSRYRAQGLVWANDAWWFGDPVGGHYGVLSESESHHLGDWVRWEFGTLITYSEGMGGIFHQMELVSLTGRVEEGKDPTISTSYTRDGRTWSRERHKKIGMRGDTLRRIAWLQNGEIGHWRIQRFKGTSDAHISVARLEALTELLSG